MSLRSPGRRADRTARTPGRVVFRRRLCIDRLQGRFSVISDLNVGIDAAYRKAGISIAFPQRDVHLDTSSPLDIRMLRAKPATDVGEGGSKDADNQNQKDGKFEQ